MIYESHPIPGGMEFPDGLTPSNEIPCEFFRKSLYEDPLEKEYEQQRKRPIPSLSIEYTLALVLIVFISATAILCVTVSTGVVNSAPGFKSYDKTYDVINPTIDQSLDTGYFQININTIQYNDGMWHTIAPAGYSYSTTTGTITIPAGSINAGTTQIEVTGTNVVADVKPITISLFSVIGMSCLIGGLFAIILTLWWGKREQVI